MLVMVTINMNDVDAGNILTDLQNHNLNYVITVTPDENVEHQENSVAILARCDAVVLTGDTSVDSTLANYALDNDIPLYHYPDLPEVSRNELDRPFRAEKTVRSLMDGYRQWLKGDSYMNIAIHKTI